MVLPSATPSDKAINAEASGITKLGSVHVEWAH